MKKIAAMLLLFSVFGLPAQDTLVLRNKQVVPALILEIGSETIRYKKPANADGPDYIAYKSEVQSIIFKNGVKETIDTLAFLPKISATPDNVLFKGQEPYNKG